MTNPNGANGTTSDPREQIMWDIYVSKLSKGIENAYESAKEAGYEEATARQITVRSWFIERKSKLKRKDMLSKAERNLDKVLDLNIEREDGSINTDVTRIVVDVSKTVVTTLGKNEGYSSRSELTGAGGKDLPQPLLYALDKENVPNNHSNKEDSETIKED